MNRTDSSAPESTRTMDVTASDKQPSQLCSKSNHRLQGGSNKMNMHVSNVESVEAKSRKLPMREGDRDYHANWLEKYPEEAEAFASMPAKELVCIFDLLTMCCDAALHMSNQPRVECSKQAGDWIEKHIDLRLSEIRQALVSGLYFREIGNCDDFEACWTIMMKYDSLSASEIDEVLRLAFDFKQIEPSEPAQLA